MSEVRAHYPRRPGVVLQGDQINMAVLFYLSAVKSSSLELLVHHRHYGHHQGALIHKHEQNKISVANPSNLGLTDPDPFHETQCCGSGSVWIRFILVSRIRIQVARNQPKSWIMSTKINQNHKNIIHFFQKTYLCLTDMNIYPINNKTDHFLE